MSLMHEAPSNEFARPSARQSLRAATADLHAIVDTRFSRAFGRDRLAYAAFLSALARAVLPLEAALEEGAVEQLMPDWPRRRRSAALHHDLRQLGLPIPVPAAVGPVAEEARLFGMLYVLEGSRLGGKLLRRRALAHPDVEVQAATQYLSHGAGSDLWRTFLDRLEASPAVARAPGAAISGARAAFALFAPEPTCD